MNMREMINVVQSSVIVEKATMVSVKTGWIRLSGEAIEATFRLWESPLKREIAIAVEQCFAMDGVPNLRGLAHAGRVYVWNANECTHAGILAYLGFHDLGARESFNYADRSYCFFLVFGQRFIDSGGEDPLKINFTGNLDVLTSTTARSWNAKYEECASGMLG